MAEQLDSLLKKIQDEAVTKADKVAQERLAAADARAKDVVAEAERRAQGLIAAAETKAAQSAESGRKALEQAARDVLIYLRQAIVTHFETLVREKVPELVPVKVIQDIMVRLATDAQARGQGTEGVRVYVSEGDYDALAKFFLNQFREKLAQGVELHPIKQIKAGFRISMANKNVVYDFSDDVLVKLMSSMINPLLEDMLKKAAVKKPGAQ